MEIEKWKSNQPSRRDIVPQRLTLTEIPRKSQPSRMSPIRVRIEQKVVMPDELKLIVFIGLVAVMVWMMLTTYIVSFSQPRIYIIESDSLTD